MTSGTAATLLVNGQPVESRAASLAALLLEQGYGNAKVATAVNGGFVPERKRAETAIRPGDRIEVVSARQGG